MRIVAVCLGVALASLSARPALAQCRCSGCGPSATTAVPQDRAFWDAQSGRYLFYASRTQTWHYWLPEQRQWAAIPTTPAGPTATSPPTQLPPTKAAPAVTDPPRHSHDPQPAPATRAQAPYGGQRTCPVTGEELGAHGTPIPVTVKGRTIYVCCRGCVTKVQRDPDTYLRKVDAELSSTPNR